MNTSVITTFTDPYDPIMTRTDISLIQFTLFKRLTSILISRFLFNLQAAEKHSTGMVSSTGSQVESAVFQHVIGSLGSEIEFGADVDVDGTEDDVRAEDSRVGGVDGRLSGREHTEGRAAEAIADD